MHDVSSILANALGDLFDRLYDQSLSVHVQLHRLSIKDLKRQNGSPSRSYLLAHRRLTHHAGWMVKEL